MDNFVRQFGPAHRRVFIENFFSIAEQFRQVSLVRTNLFPFAGVMTNRHIVVMAAIFADFRCRSLGDNRRTSMLTLAVGEVAGCRLADEQYAPEAVARVNVCNALIYAKANGLLPTWADVAEASWDEFRLSAPVMGHYPGLEAGCPLLQAGDEAMTAEIGVALLWYLASISNPEPRRCTIEILVVSYVAAAKRGNLGDNAQNKIVTSIREELNVNVVLSEEVVNLTFRYFMKGINELNAAHTFQTLADNVPDIGMRIILLLNQAAWSGLTIYVIVRDAMRLYANFPWYQVELATNGQMTNWCNASLAIAANPFYGFKADLGEAKSTLYKGPGYVAKELLVKIKGDLPLRQYRGLGGAIPGKARLDQLIQTYVAERLAVDGNNVAVPPDEFVRLMARADAAARPVVPPQGDAADPNAEQ